MLFFHWRCWGTTILNRWKSYLRRLWCTCFLAAHFSLARIRVTQTCQPTRLQQSDDLLQLRSAIYQTTAMDDRLLCNFPSSSMVKVVKNTRVTFCSGQPLEPPALGLNKKHIWNPIYDQEKSAQMYDRSAEEHFRPLNPLCVQKIFMSESSYETCLAGTIIPANQRRAKTTGRGSCWRFQMTYNIISL